MKLTDSATNLLVSALNDIEEPFSSELEETATSVAGCLKNVLQSSIGRSQANGNSFENQSSSKVGRPKDMLNRCHHSKGNIPCLNCCTLSSWLGSMLTDMLTSKDKTKSLVYK